MDDALMLEELRKGSEWFHSLPPEEQQAFEESLQADAEFVEAVAAATAAWRNVAAVVEQKARDDATYEPLLIETRRGVRIAKFIQRRYARPLRAGLVVRSGREHRVRPRLRSRGCSRAG